MYEIQQQQQQTKTATKLLQTFPHDGHSSSRWIRSLIQINPNTIVSACDSSSSSSNTMVIWTKSKSSSSLEYEPIQRITRKETGGDIINLVLINQKKEGEDEFASCSYWDRSIIIWRRGKGEEEFQIKQKIQLEELVHVEEILYISQNNELISLCGICLQIWSPSSSSSSDFVEKQKIKTSYLEHPVISSFGRLCQINEINNDSRRIEFATGHMNGQIMIWSKQINESNYSLIKTLQPFNVWVNLIYINDNEFNFLISCCSNENKIKIFKGEGEEELKHEGVSNLIPMSNGLFSSGGLNRCLNIWSPSFSSSLHS